MGIRAGFRSITEGYRKTARIAVLAFIFFSLFAPLFVQAQTSSSPKITIVSAASCVETQLSGTSLVVYGNFTMSGFSAPVYLKGYASVSVTQHNALFGDITRYYSWSFNSIWYNGFGGTGSCGQPGGATSVPNPVNPIGGSFSFATSCWIFGGGCVFPLTIGVSYSVNSFTIVLDAYNDSAMTQFITQSNTYSGYSGENPTFQLLVALPMFNDTAFDTIVHCPQALYPCSLNPSNDASKDPLGIFYTFVAGISLGLAVLAFMVGYASNSMQGKNKIPFVDLMITVAFIIVFPYIYNQVAALVNYLDMALVAGPGNDFTTYGASIQLIWTKSGASVAGGLWNIITGAGLVQLAAWVVDFIVYIGAFILGTIRIWLIAVMIAAFPLALALKQVPFTRKLGQMVEDTLFGLMLAAIMSSVVLGLSALLLQTGTNNTLFGSSIWLAAISLLTALLLPTVFAPLTGVMFQTGMQAAMTAGTAAVLAGTGGAMGGVGGFQAMGQVAGGVGGAAGSLGTLPASTGTKLASMLQQHGTIGSAAYGTMHALRGAGLGLAAGLTSGMGMHEAGKVFRYEMKSPGQIVHDRQVGLQEAAQVQMTTEAQQLVAQHNATFQNLFSKLGVLSPEVNAVMQQRLGSHFTDSSAPNGITTVESWYKDVVSAPPSRLALDLGRHGWIDHAKYESNPVYRSTINQSLSSWRLRLNELDPRKSSDNLQKIADLRNLLNSGPEKD